MKRTPSLRLCLGLAFLACVVSLGIIPGRTSAQNNIGSFERERGRIMLKQARSDIEKYYYDTGYRGVNLETGYKEADELIKKATSNGQIFGIIANFLVKFNDSHTFFLPPSRAARTEYGWQMQMFGNECYVTAVKPGSDAEAKGLKPGDMVLNVDGMRPSREDLWKIQYLYYQLRPTGGMQVVVQSPDGKQRQLDVLAKITTHKRITDLTDYSEYMRLVLEDEKEARLNSDRYLEAGDELFIWKMPAFDMDEDDVDKMMAKVKKRKALILDLRGNGGGLVRMLERLVGHFFDRDVKIADLKGRKEMKPQLAKTRGKDIFTGPVIVLIDSQSGSASEIFARVMQLEKRGTVIGDRSSGAVMQSIRIPHEVGVDTVAFYGFSVTNADCIMMDGKSLEGVGVVPDEVLLPTAADMAANRDPVLARAATLLGIKLDAEKAGTLFPIEWRK